MASAIKDFLAGDISSCLQFLEQDLFIQDQLRDLLQEQFGRLTPLSHDKTIKLWDVRSGECLKTLKRDSSEVWAIATARDGRTLASGSADGAMALWEIETGERLRTMRTPRLYEGMNIMGVTGVTDAEKSTLKAGN
ncbi:WD40 repeat domain-containing protein [Microseira wollei]|uniref:WD40 repeat domain-containing protein n=1 Tax=Microseira wollei TaxID=467598 RepID=UPI001CFDBADC|nr:hypothetical protein [Microseira wollei]